LDLVADDPRWADWSQQQLDLASAHDQLAINNVVYAELSIGYARMEQLDAMISSAGLVCAVMPRPALFLAGKAFQRYRSAGGRKTGVLPDFFIGAHAVIADACRSPAMRLAMLLPGDHADRPVVIAAPRLSGSNGEGAARA
jgi:predicted nucleic acid-binding protein